MNEKPLDRYARLLVEHALCLREGQRLGIWGETGHREGEVVLLEQGLRAGWLEEKMKS